MAVPMICVHRLNNGRPLFFRVGLDRVVPLTKPVVVVVKDEKFEVCESKREIDKLIREA